MKEIVKDLECAIFGPSEFDDDKDDDKDDDNKDDDNKDDDDKDDAESDNDGKLDNFQESIAERVKKGGKIK